MQLNHPMLIQSLSLIIQEGVIFLLILALNFLIRMFMKKLYSQIQHKKGDVLDESFIGKLVKPLRLMIWLVGISYMVYVFIRQLQLMQEVNSTFMQWRNLIIIMCVSWLCFEVKKQLQLSWKKSLRYSGKHLDQSRVDLISKLFSILIVTLAAMIILQTLGVDITAIVAFGGVGGLAIGFASKDIIANYFSGFMIHITRPFKVGDWIYTPDEVLNGTVEYIGYYITVIRGFDKRPYYVPNALFSSKMIINASRMTNRRIKHTVGVRYDDFHVVRKIVDEIRQMLKTHEDIDANQHLLVDFIEYGPHSLNIQVYTFTKTTVWRHWLDIQQDILLRIGEIILKNGAQIAFPTTTLDFPKEVLNQIVPPPSDT